MNPSNFIVIAGTILLTSCAFISYETPSQVREHTDKISASINAEHERVFTETLKYLRPCWEGRSSLGVDSRVTSGFGTATSRISVGLYSRDLFSSEIFTQILLVIDMSSNGAKTDVVISGRNRKKIIVMLEKMKFIAVGKTSKCEEIGDLR